jgi:hypothetical protein
MTAVARPEAIYPTDKPRQSQRVVRQKNMAMGPKTKNNCTGEGQQQITTQPDRQDSQLAVSSRAVGG